MWGAAVWRAVPVSLLGQSRYLGLRRLQSVPAGINWPISHRYMATSGLDHQLKIFDLRGTFQPLSSRTLPQGAGHLAFSQRGLLVAGMGDVVNIWAGQGKGSPPSLEQPYLTHRLSGNVHGLQFCPFEDVLGVGHSGGITSMLVPGEWPHRTRSAHGLEIAREGQQASQSRTTGLGSVPCSSSVYPSLAPSLRGC